MRFDGVDTGNINPKEQVAAAGTMRNNGCTPVALPCMKPNQ